MRFEADLLLKVNLGGGLEALHRPFFLLSEELLDGVAHAFGFYRRLGFGLDSKPGLPAWGIANVFHASLPIFLRRTGIANHRAGAALSAEDGMPTRLGPQPLTKNIVAFLGRLADLLHVAQGAAAGAG